MHRRRYWAGCAIVPLLVGWIGGWTYQPSVYSVAARRASDIVADVNLARERNLRLVNKGGGHSDLGTSNAPNSLLIWTRAMDGITVHDDFVGQGCRDALRNRPIDPKSASISTSFGPLKVKSGRTAIPDRPALGIEIDRGAIEAAHALYRKHGLGARDDAVAMQFRISGWTFDDKRSCLVR